MRVARAKLATMALIGSHSRCAVCGDLLAKGQSVFATSGVWLPRDHPLWKFCDAPIHWECLATWPEREAFARERLRALAKFQTYGPIVLSTDDVLVTVARRPNGPQIKVVVGATGAAEYVRYDDWERWLEDGGALPAATVHPWQRLALEPLIPLLRRELPTTARLDEKARLYTDWPAYEREQRRQAAAHEAQHAVDEAARDDRDAQMNEQTEALARTLQSDGVTCPHCAATRRDHRYRAADSRVRAGYFVCMNCKRSFTGADAVFD